MDLINKVKSINLQNMEVKEIWKDIEGYQGLYQVSSEGRVRSLKRIDSLGHLRKERILSPRKNKRGYLQVYLSKDCEQKNLYVHRLVFSAFKGEIPEGMEINHKDEDKTNNRLENLNLLTAKANVNWGTRNLRASQSMKGKLINRKDKSKIVAQYSLDGTFIQVYPSANEVQRQLGFEQSSISACCRGKLKTSYNYIWKYI